MRIADEAVCALCTALGLNLIILSDTIYTMGNESIGTAILLTAGLVIIEAGNEEA